MGRVNGLDELDFHLITALQIEPRADWLRIGHVLGVTPTTAVRRWMRLSEAGLAWLSCHPMRLPDVSPVVAIVEVDCSSGHVHQVAEQIARDHHVLAVNMVTGARDLVFIAAFVDHESLARYLGFRLDRLAGVKATRCHIVSTIHSEGSRWRLERLDNDRRARLRRQRPVPNSLPAPDAADMAIISSLAEDCRRPLAELAERTNLSPSTVNRRLTRLEADRSVVYRCDVARAEFGWPVELMAWATAPAEHLHQAIAQLTGMREVRFCATVTGPSNIIFVGWFRSTLECNAFEAHVRRRISELVVTDRAVTLWQMKLAGNILDPRSRLIQRVPIAPWAEDQAAEDESKVLNRLRVQDRPWPKPPGAAGRRGPGGTAISES
jgi:DNA-binding Lrp family transcriptional regulator